MSVLETLGWSLAGSINEAPRSGDIQQSINDGKYKHVFDTSNEAQAYLLEKQVATSHLTETRNVGSTKQYYHYTVSDFRLDLILFPSEICDLLLFYSIQSWLTSMKPPLKNGPFAPRRVYILGSTVSFLATLEAPGICVFVVIFSIFHL